MIYPWMFYVVHDLLCISNAALIIPKETTDKTQFLCSFIQLSNQPGA